MGKKRIGSLDFLRICAAYLIVCHHWQQVLGVHFSIGVNYFGAGSVFDFGYLVGFFYILSGFLAEYSFNEERSFREFYSAKISRLLPVLALSVALYDLFIILYAKLGGTEWFFPVEIDVWGSIITAFGISAGWSFANPGVNNPSYYVSVLILCSILHYVVKQISLKKKWNEVVTYGIVIFLSVSIWTFYNEYAFFNLYTNRGYYCFFIGAVVAQYYRKNGPWNMRQSAAGVLVIALWIYIYATKPEWLENSPNFVCAFIVYPILIMLFLSPLLQKVLGFKVLSFLGGASYSTYLLHVPFMLCLRILIQCGLQIDLSQRLYMRLFLVFMVLVGIVTYSFFEKPMGKLLKKKLGILLQ